MGKTIEIEYSNPIVADKAKHESQMYGPEDSSAWIAYDSGLPRIDFGFRHVLKDLGFSSLRGVCDSFAQPDQKPTGLELAGQGKVFSELNMDGVACCLAFPKYLVDAAKDSSLPLRKKPEQISTKVALVAGDLAQPATFRAIQARLNLEVIAKPNLILLTPAGGLDYLPGPPEFFAKIVKPAIGLCDEQCFAFLGETPEGTELLLEAFLAAIKTDAETQICMSKCGDVPIFGIYRNKLA